MDCSNSNEISQRRGGIKVLLVDKDTNFLMTMSMILEERLYGVTTTKSTFAAMSMIFEQQNKFDIIICEIDMPGMDGFELLKQITSTIDIPTILVSTTEDFEVARKALKEGACSFFHKPIGPHNLVNIWQFFITHCSGKGPLQEGATPRELATYFSQYHGETNSPVPENSLAMGNSRMLDMSQDMSAESIIYQFPDDDSLGGNDSEGSVNGPSPPRIGTATTGDRDAETSSDKSVEDDMNRLLDDI